MAKVKLYWETGRHLRPRQIFYRFIFYPIRRKYRKLLNFKYPLSISNLDKVEHLSLLPSIIAYKSYHGNNSFEFLNLEESFTDKIDWNFSEYGKLWTYNLNYFEFLNQKDISTQEGLRLIHDFFENLSSESQGLEPYPTSLRIINWIKFLIKTNNYQQSLINESLYGQSMILADNLEYHIMGNHLLENGFGLLFASYFFQDNKLYRKAKKIVIRELNEQILDDGAHYELSPMYHQIILFRILDCLNLVKNNQWKNGELLPLLIEKAEIMLEWLNKITFTNAEIPYVNDSAPGISPTTQQLNEYAEIILATDYADTFKNSFLTTNLTNAHQ